MQNGEHKTMHWTCCGKPVIGRGLWILSLLAFGGGLVAFWRGGEFYGVSLMTWYWTALVGGVLAAGKSGGCGFSCGACAVKR